MPKYVPTIGKATTTNFPEKFTNKSKAGETYIKMKFKTPSGHHVYLRKPQSSQHAISFMAIHPKTKEVHAQIFGSLEGQHLNITWAEKNHQAPFKMGDFSKTLLNNGYTLESSDEHSKGSVDHWRDLANDPDIEVIRHNTFSHATPRQLELHRGGDWMKNYDDPHSTFIARKKK